ncbi:MAG: ATP-binding protein [Lachnospiraceae bacterium]|nr:ATP-binding protein [Lachnospiraceae bacterium]
MSEEALKENRLFLSCLAYYSRLKEVEKAFLFFSQEIVVYRTNVDEPRTNNWYEYSVELMEKNPNVKKAFVLFLKALDTGIEDVKAKTREIDTEELTKGMPGVLKNLFLSPEVSSGTVKNIETKVIYRNFETDLMTEESTGIRKLFQIVCPVLDILTTGKVLICDEIETGLHEAVVHKIIELFYEMSPEKFAQLIFTTHDTSLLDAKMFRRDQIWFTQLEPEYRATDLYSLVEIKNVRNNENLAKGYVSGKYGAIPVLNDSFKAFIESVTSLGEE